MRVARILTGVVAGSIACAAWTGVVQAGVINVPNASFELPTVPFASPYATSSIDNWQKAPPPAWWLGAGYSQQQWIESAGVFVNVPFAPIDNADGNQCAFFFGTPGVELYQDLDATFEVGQAYQLVVAAMGGGYGMKLGVPIEFRLYYRDDSIVSGDNRVTVGAVEAKNANPSNDVKHLTDYQLDIPAVMADDPWAGMNIGIQIISTVGFEDAGGFWDLDNVRLTAVPEPGSALVLGLASLGLLSRRRRA